MYRSSVCGYSLFVASSAHVDFPFARIFASMICFAVPSYPAAPSRSAIFLRLFRSDCIRTSALGAACISRLVLADVPASIFHQIFLRPFRSDCIRHRLPEPAVASHQCSSVCGYSLFVVPSAHVDFPFARIFAGMIFLAVPSCPAVPSYPAAPSRSAIFLRLFRSDCIRASALGAAPSGICECVTSFFCRNICKSRLFFVPLHQNTRIALRNTHNIN